MGAIRQVVWLPHDRRVLELPSRRRRTAAARKFVASRVYQDGHDCDDRQREKDLVRRLKEGLTQISLGGDAQVRRLVVERRAGVVQVRRQLPVRLDGASSSLPSNTAFAMLP